MEQESDSFTVPAAERFDSFTFRGTAAVLQGGRLRLDFGAGDQGPPPLLGLPGAGGTAMILVPEVPEEGRVLGILALRQASKLKAADLGGAVEGVSFELGFTAYGLEGGVQVPDIQAGDESLHGSLDGAGKVLSLSAHRRGLRRDGGDGRLRSTVEDDSFSIPLAINAKGVIKATDPEGGRMVGAVAEGGEVWFVMPDPARKGNSDFLAVFVRGP